MRKVKRKEHVHKWKLAYTVGTKAIGESCEDCGFRMERPATKREERKLEADQKRRQAESDTINRVNWEFMKTFKGDSGWKYKSYALMTRIRKWAKKWPKDVIVCGIDDSVNANSDLVFILHRIGRRLWGTTCYTITQCDGQPPNEWFMYPGHREGIEKAFQVMARYKSFYDEA